MKPAPFVQAFHTSVCARGVLLRFEISQTSNINGGMAAMKNQINAYWRYGAAKLTRVSPPWGKAPVSPALASRILMLMNWRLYNECRQYGAWRVGI